MIIDIRDFNKLSIIDEHSIFMQNDIIAHIRNNNHLNLMNDLIFFLQFSIIEKNKHKFSFIIHRDKEQLNVTTMRFKNSSFYVQRIMNEQLRKLREFCRIYIDDIVVFFKIFATH